MVKQWVYTRFGIGIADEQWWDFRTRLFMAVTAPSLLRHVHAGVEWIIFTDYDVPRQTRQALDSISGQHGMGRVRVRPLRFVCELPEALQWEIGRDDSVGITRLDDDDAISEDFFEGLIPLQGSRIVTQPWGYEADLATRMIRPIHAPLLSLNTTFIGKSSLAAEYARVGHHRLADWAARRGYPLEELDPISGKSFIYSRHKQSDSSFGARRQAIRDDPASTIFTASARSRFGIDEAAFQSWREFARTAPAAPSSKTWDRTSQLNEDAYKVHSQLLDIRRELRNATKKIFG